MFSSRPNNDGELSFFPSIVSQPTTVTVGIAYSYQNMYYGMFAATTTFLNYTPSIISDFGFHNGRWQFAERDFDAGTSCSI
jgi:hypothetical protein